MPLPGMYAALTVVAAANTSILLNNAAANTSILLNNGIEMPTMLWGSGGATQENATRVLVYSLCVPPLNPHPMFT